LTKPNYRWFREAEVSRNEIASYTNLTTSTLSEMRYYLSVLARTERVKNKLTQQKYRSTI